MISSGNETRIHRVRDNSLGRYIASGRSDCAQMSPRYS
jgi:hypothetical protein